jgi:hypothetical protein
LTLGFITTSLFGVTNDSWPFVLISRRSSGDGVLKRLNLIYSKVNNSSSVDRDLRLLEIAFGFNLNLMQLQSIIAALPSNFFTFKTQISKSL